LIDETFAKTPFSVLVPILREFFLLFELRDLSFALFLKNEIKFFPSENYDPNNIYCIFKNGEEINPLYFQEAERNLIFNFLLDR